MGEEEKVSRRRFIEIAGGTVAGLAVGAAAGYLSGKAAAPTVEKITETVRETITKTVTAAPTPTLTPTKRPIKMGVPATITGWNAAEGTETTRAIYLAAEEINAAGGILGHPIEVIPGDTHEMEPGVVVDVVEKLITKDKVDIMLTSYCSNTLPEVEMAEEYRIPYMFAGIAQMWEEMVQKKDYKYVRCFMVSYRGYRTELPKLVDERWRQKGLFVPKNNKVAMIIQENPYSIYIGEGIRDNLRDKGWTVTLDELVPTETITEWGPILEKIRSDPPDLIASTDYIPSNEAAFLSQFLEDPTPSLVFMQYGPSLPEFIDLTGDASTGVIWYTVAGFIQDPELYPRGYEYAQKFLNRWGDPPGPIYAAHCYDMVYCYKKAVEIAGDPFDYEAVADALLQIDYYGVMGHFVMDPELKMPKGGFEYIPMCTFQIWDRKQVLIGENPLARQDLREPPWVAPAREKYDP